MYYVNVLCKMYYKNVLLIYVIVFCYFKIWAHPKEGRSKKKIKTKTIIDSEIRFLKHQFFCYKYKK